MGKKVEEPSEEELAAAAAAEAAEAALAAEEANPFSKYNKIWELETLEEQRALVSTIFELEDGPPHSIQAIKLDKYFGHLIFAKDAGLSRDQAEEFMGIMEKLDASAISGSTDLQSCFKTFRDAVLQNSTLNPPPPPPPKETVKEPEEEPKDTKKKATSKGKKGKDKDPEPVVVADPIPIVPVRDPLAKLFTPEQIKAMTIYTKSGIFAHLNLYRAMYNPELFTPNILTEKVEVSCNNVITDGLNLADATSIEVIEQRRADEAEKTRLAEEAEAARLYELNKPDITKMVEKHLAIARHEMMQKLEEQAQGFEVEIEALFTQLSGGK